MIPILPVMVTAAMMAHRERKIGTKNKIQNKNKVDKQQRQGQQQQEQAPIS